MTSELKKQISSSLAAPKTLVDAGYDLFSPAESREKIAAIKEVLKDQKDGFFSKKDDFFKENLASLTPYSVIKQNNHYFLVFPGKKHGKLLGEGFGGKVKYGRDLDSGKFVAVKVSDGSSNPYEQLIIQQLNRHPAYPKTEQKLTEKDIPEIVKKSGKTVIVMNLEEGVSLESFIRAAKGSSFSFKEAVIVIKNILEEMKPLMQNKIFHRDLQSKNIMFEPSTLKTAIVDFNISVFEADSDSEYLFLGSEFVTRKDAEDPEIMEDLALNEGFSMETEMDFLGTTFKQVLDVVDKSTRTTILDKNLEEILEQLANVTNIEGLQQCINQLDNILLFISGKYRYQGELDWSFFADEADISTSPSVPEGSMASNPFALFSSATPQSPQAVSSKKKRGREDDLAEEPAKEKQHRSCSSSSSSSSSTL